MYALTLTFLMMIRQYESIGDIVRRPVRHPKTTICHFVGHNNNREKLWRVLTMGGQRRWRGCTLSWRPWHCPWFCYSSILLHSIMWSLSTKFYPFLPTEMWLWKFSVTPPRVLLISTTVSMRMELSYFSKPKLNPSQYNWKGTKTSDELVL